MTNKEADKLYRSFLDEVCPERDKLRQDENGEWWVSLLDEEDDVFYVKFIGDGLCEIKPNGNKYLALSDRLLIMITDYMEIADEKYNSNH